MKHSAAAPPGTVQQLLDQERHRRASLENTLAGRYANGALVATAIQVVIADTGFFVYGFTNHWAIPPTVIDVWLGATVVQIIGVVYVITNSLFPSSDRRF